MSIFIISRRPLPPHNEKAWGYRTRMTADNAAVNAETDSARVRAYAKLRVRIEAMAHSWRVAEPDSEFRVVDTGLGKDDKFAQPVDKPVEHEPAVAFCDRDDQSALVRQLEFLVEKARYGMGMPYSKADVDHYEGLLAEARRAQPDDPGVALARKLASNYLDGGES